MTDFKTELKELLAKYNVGIGWSCDSGSDLHGVTGMVMEVYDTKTGKILFEVEGTGIDKDNIPD